MAAAELGTEESKGDFGKKMSEITERGFIGLGVAIGVSTGLLGKMSSFAGPKTSQQIADESGLKERYVREWLGIMVCGGIIDLDTTSQTFFLPHHRRPFFTRGCPEETSSLFMRCLPMAASSFDDVSQCFKLDGPIGIPYSHFNYNPEMSRVRFEDHLIKDLGTVPGLRNELESGIGVLDVACGSGVSTLLMAKQFPNSRFTGLDIASDVIDVAKREATNQKLLNAEFVCASAMDMPSDWSGKFDFLFLYNGVHDASRPDWLLKECFRVIKSGAKAIIQEPRARSNMADNIGMPFAACRYTLSLFRCLPTSMSSEDSLGLGAAWGKENCQQLLEETGFNVVLVDEETGGATCRFSCTKPL